MPATRHPTTEAAKVSSWKCGLRKDAEAFWPSSVTLGSPSDNTNPRCQMVARGLGFCLYLTVKLLHWVLSRGAGWPGRGSEIKANSIFSASTRSSGSPERGQLHRCLFVGTWLHQNPTDSSEPIVPGQPGTARQYPMLDARYISTTQAAHVF